MAAGLKTGGRKKGTKNKATIEREAMVHELIGAEAFAGDAHGFLISVYKDPRIPLQFRIDSAKAAARYEKAQLAHIETVNETVVRYVARIPEKAKAPIEWQQQHAPLTLQ